MTTLATPQYTHRRALSDIGVGQPSRSRSRDPSPSPYRASFEHQPHYAPPSPYHSSHSSRDQSPYKAREPSPYSVRVPAPAPPGRGHSREPVHRHIRTTSFPTAAPPFPRPNVLVPSPAPTHRTLAPAHEYDYGYDSDFLTAPPAPQPHSHSRSRSHSQSHPNGLPSSLPKYHHVSAPAVPTVVPTYVVNVPAPAPAPRSRSPRGRRSRDSPPSKSRSKTRTSPTLRTASRVPAPAPPKIHVVDFAAHQAQSARPYQEDGYVIGPPARYTSRSSDTTAPVTAFFGVYDGHGGAFSSTHAARALHSHLIRSRAFGVGGRSGYEAALREAFAKEDAKLRAHQRAQHCGSTAVVALIDADAGQLYVANAGDSRAVLAARDGSHMRAIRVSEDHNPTNPAERARIEAAGGFITADGRVGTLAVSRGLGDHAYKLTPGAPGQGASPAFHAALRPGMQPTADLVSGSPHIASVALSGTGTPFLVLGSDGLFNALSDQTIVDTVAKLFAQKWSAKAMAQHLVDTAVGKSTRGRGDGDNVTAVVVVFA